MNKPQDPEAAETVQTTSVPAVDLPRLVRLLRSMWDDVGIHPKDALMAFTAGIFIAIPVMGVVWITAWILCRWTSKPMDDNAFAASVGLWFVVFIAVRSITYIRDKWRESGKPNTL